MRIAQNRMLTDLCPGYNQSGNRDKLLQSFDHFCPAARKIVSYADADVRVWVLYDMRSLSTWTQERLALIGDAAHPFLPCTIHYNFQIARAYMILTRIAVLGQGGAMAIEDAISIARLLPADTPVSAITERLKAFEEIRHGRAEYVREETRENGLDEMERSTGALKFAALLLGT